MSDGIRPGAVEASAPLAPGELDRVLASLRTRLHADGVALVAGGRHGRPVRVMWAVRVHMELVLRNLLTNALKYGGAA